MIGSSKYWKYSLISSINDQCNKYMKYSINCLIVNTRANNRVFAVWKFRLRKREY